MRDLAIAMRIGSAETKLEIVKGTIESIQKNIGKCDYTFVLSLDPTIPNEVKEYIYSKQKTEPERFHILGEETIYWSEFINKAIAYAKDFEYFIKAHDDIDIHTNNFWAKIKETLATIKSPVAWISFNEMSYLDGHWNPPTRPGYFTDVLKQNAWERRKIFQFHNLPEGWWRAPFWRELPYLIQQKILIKLFPTFRIFHYPIVKMTKENQQLVDTPAKPVKCHAPWNTFVLIKMSVLKEIGLCENWQTYNALFVDEDWGLRAMEKGYANIWIPQIEYYHVKPLIGGDRSQFQIKQDNKRVGDLFFQKWGFHAKPINNELELIKKNNLISWSVGRNSYDWDYVL